VLRSVDLATISFPGRTSISFVDGVDTPIALDLCTSVSLLFHLISIIFSVHQRHGASWEKNLHLLTQAYRALDREHCHLVIVGDGPALKGVQQDVADLPVTFTGYLKGEQLASAYASADIFAFPSTSETFGQVVLEAMASGLPVVGVLSEGVCDLVHNEQTGLMLDMQGLSEDEQVYGYLTYLQRLIYSASARNAMGQAALLEASQRSWPEAIDCLLRGYHEAIEERSPLIAA
jgi:glycosyltransferase involved in cell wall biosynthesis